MSSILDSVRANSEPNTQDLDKPKDERPELALRKAWTLGDSNALVDGSPQESKLVSIMWILVPSIFALGVLYLMMPR